MFEIRGRADFLRLAFLFEGGLVGLAFALDALLPRPETAASLAQQLAAFDLPALGWGLLATLPMLAFYVLAERSTWGPLRRIREFLVEELGPALLLCRWYDFVWIALLAGFGEELVFRGALQPRIGLIAASVLFGCVHSITPAYVLLAGAIGFFLGWLTQATGNLWPAILSHGLYDLFAFAMITRLVRREPPIESSDDGAD
ncbi:MAG TPA: CPBP family intramembrane glutamic endopeptidase [Planctomycetaceae bacterium]|nr:CPBP family intramembrane glutamic endopeptidase [Planctomycetaceae bacterium]